jgi:hypothetical protein
MTADWSGGITVALVPPVTTLAFSAAFTWDAGAQQLGLDVVITAAGVFSLAVALRGEALPGSPLAVTVVPGPLAGTMSALVGVGAVAADPGQSNEVALVLRDAFGNLLPPAAVSPASVSLSVTPAAAAVAAFQVCCTHMLLWLTPSAQVTSGGLHTWRMLRSWTPCVAHVVLIEWRMLRSWTPSVAHVALIEWSPIGLLLSTPLLARQARCQTPLPPRRREERCAILLTRWAPCRVRRMVATARHTLSRRLGRTCFRRACQAPPLARSTLCRQLRGRPGLLHAQSP